MPQAGITQVTMGGPEIQSPRNNQPLGRWLVHGLRCWSREGLGCNCGLDRALLDFRQGSRWGTSWISEVLAGQGWIRHLDGCGAPKDPCGCGLHLAFPSLIYVEPPCR